MKNIEFSEENLAKLYDNLRQNDKNELSFYVNNKKDFIKICIESKKDAYFLADDLGNPIAIGGAKKINKKTAQLWLLSTIHFEKHKFHLMKLIYSKIKKFKRKYDKLFNNIYFENFESIIWLKKCGFKIIDTNDKRFKLFYFNKEEN